MDVNENLYKDAQFRLLQFKKNGNASNFLGVVRQLISLSDVHCSDQNMTEHGAREYKTELFAEYFKTLDSRDEDGLLPVMNDPSENFRFCYQSSQKPLNKVCIEKCKTLLLNFKIGNSKNAVEPKSFSAQSSNKKISDFFLKTGDQKNNSAATTSKTSANFFHKAAEPKVNSYQMPYKNSNSVSNYRKENHQSEMRSEHNAVFSNRLSKKNKFEELTESNSLKNKKVCLQSKSSEIGFVSASTMYRNPLKKSSNSSNLNASSPKETSKEDEDSEPSKNPAFKNFDKKIVDIVLNEIMDFSPNVKWSDIAGLDFVKTTVQEIVIWPLLRPDIFTGLRAPPRGILLFGPPGTGKTLIGKCIATESNSTFFCISASSLASKWVGESEQMVRVLFAAARLNQPSVIFIDEIDSLLSQRSDKDQDFTRKLKTEFLVQFDGAKTNTEERVLVVGATNRPHELDEAARRRFVKRLFVPLPDTSARRQIIQKLLDAHQHDLSAENLQQICDETEGYSGSDVAHLCKEAAMGPIRSIGPAQIKTVSLDQVRPISLCDFIHALRQVRASVVADDLNYYMDWNKKFGSFGIPT